MAFNMLANVLVHSLVHSLNQDANQRLFLMLLHILVHILVLILIHMLNHTRTDPLFEHSIALVFDIPFLLLTGHVEIIASHSWKAVTRAARTHFEGVESSYLNQVVESR